MGKKAWNAAVILFFYVLVPSAVLWLLAKPLGDAVLRSGQAVFLILPAALAAVGLNWAVRRAVHRRRPPLPVFAHGALCLLAVILILYGALPVYGDLRPAMAALGGFLAMLSLLLFSFWFAARPSRPAHVVAVGFRIAVGLILFFMACQIVRDIEVRQVTRYTWITAAILVLTVLVRCAPRITAAFRRSGSRRRAAGLASGRIEQIIGETRLDLDGDPVTLYHARVRYSVNDTEYETKADITLHTIRKYGKAAFVGRLIPVWYNPDDPADAFTDKIEKPLPDP